MPSFRRLLAALGTGFCLVAALSAQPAPAPAPAPEAVLARIYAEALAHGEAYENLRALVGRYPGRLSGSPALAGAVTWAEATLRRLGPDRVFRQDVLVPHWERGAPESVHLLGPGGQRVALPALALGGSVATPAGGLEADVVEVKSLSEAEARGAQLAGKVVFFNRPMDPAIANGGTAYVAAVDQRSRGPALAARFGAAAVLVRSMTQARDDLPHTGNTSFPGDAKRLPALAISTLAADRLTAAVAAAAAGGPPARVAVVSHARVLPDAPSHNVIAEIKGSEFPDRVILVSGHLDSWDIAPGAHDNGAGVVQSIEVLRIFRTLGLKPRHTLRCVLFTNEENGLRGSTAYIDSVKRAGERHVLAVETDNGGFQPTGFNLGSTQGDAHARAAAKWSQLFAPYGIAAFRKGTGGADVANLLPLGVTVAGLTPDSPRYFDTHHTVADSFDKVHPRELHLGAAALAALIWLTDTQGL